MKKPGKQSERDKKFNESALGKSLRSLAAHVKHHQERQIATAVDPRYLEGNFDNSNFSADTHTRCKLQRGSVTNKSQAGTHRRVLPACPKNTRWDLCRCLLG